MAGRQTQLDFRGADADHRAAYQERNNELRSRLRSIDARLTGLSRRQWEQTCELLMSVWAHTTTTKSKQSGSRATTCTAVERLMATSGLTPRQFREARGRALRLGVLRSVRSYAAASRTPDRLEVDLGGVDSLATESRSLAHQKPGCNPAATRLQPGCSDAETHVYPRARAGAVKDLPITSTSTSSAGAREPASEIAAAPEVAEEEEEVTFQKLIAICRSVQMPMPDRFREAIQTARASGCSFRQLAGRCQWFHRHWAEWPSSHRKGAIYYGLKNATPDMPANAGWPYR